MLLKNICIVASLVISGCGDGNIEISASDSDGLPKEKIQQVSKLTSEHYGILFVWVNPGKKAIGTNNSQSSKHERPQVLFELKQGFYIGKTEVTANQYRLIFPSAKGLYAEGEQPVRVMWSDAKAYCNKLNDLRISSGKKKGVFRLPYEFEWEYVATFGRPVYDDWWPTHSRHPDIFMSKYENYDINYAQREIYTTNSVNNVGQLKPNLTGVYDVLGNISEWCEGYFAQDVSSMINAEYHENDTFGGKRPIRGGDFLDSIEQLRPSIRRARSNHTVAGFRILFDPLADLGEEKGAD